MRFGVMYPVPDAVSPLNWSGTPCGLAGGLAASGIDVVPIGAKIPFVIRKVGGAASLVRGRHGALADRTSLRDVFRHASLSRNLAHAGRLDGLIAMGTDLYDLRVVRPMGIPTATYDDGTLMQMWRNQDSDIRRAGFSWDEVENWFRRQAISSRAASLCCVSTNWAGNSVVADYGLPLDRVRVVGMGHRPRRVSEDKLRNWARPRFLFVGVDWRRKNGDGVLRAFERLRMTSPDATLDVVGDHPRINVEGVTGHGFLARDNASSQEKLDYLFARATAFVLPSRFDPSPIAYLEAASAGLPVVATTEGGAGELLGPAAITVHPDDGKGLINALQRLVDPSVAAEMGRTAAQRASASSWKHVAARIVDQLISLQGESVELRRSLGPLD